MLEIEFAELTDAGLKRDQNEDCVGHVAPSSPIEVRSSGWFFCMADGMGAHAYGEVASRLSVDTACSEFRKGPKGVMHVSLLPRLVQAANIAVYDAGHAANTYGGPMGTTIVACALRFDSAVVSHVGDSRCYLFRAGRLAQLTRDHTMQNEHLRLGILAVEDAGSGDGSNILTRSLGMELFVAADTITVNVIAGDIILLCTDGLHGYIEGDLISRLLQSAGDLEKAATALIAATHCNGAPDNISVQLIRIRSVERMGLYRGRPYRLL